MLLITNDGSIPIISCFDSLWINQVYAKFKDSITVVSYDTLPSDICAYDYIICLSTVRAFTRSANEKRNYQRIKDMGYRGKFVQYSDGPSAKDDQPDVLCLYAMGNTNHPNNIHIPWAADNILLYPEQDERLTVLVDHIYPDRPHNKSFIFKELEKLRALVPNARILDTNHGRIIETDMYDSSQTYVQGIPFNELAKVYRKTHIFMPTHKESMGLVTLEAAMCGALTVSANGFLLPRVLDNIPHVLYNNNIDWKSIINNLDIKSNYEMVKHFTWTNSMNKLSEELKKRI